MVSISRPLTAGERKIVAYMFGEAVDPEPVRVIHRKWWPFQPRNVVMAPCGHLHIAAKSDLWSKDFSAEDIKLQGLFVHEMTHVWQAQLRGRFYLPLMRHPFCRYDYEYEEQRRFHEYGLEQQGEIVRHVFLMRQGEQVEGKPALAILERILDFGRS